MYNIYISPISPEVLCLIIIIHDVNTRVCIRRRIIRKYRIRLYYTRVTRIDDYVRKSIVHTIWADLCGESKLSFLLIYLRIRYFLSFSITARAPHISIHISLKLILYKYIYIYMYALEKRSVYYYYYIRRILKYNSRNLTSSTYAIEINNDRIMVHV